MRILSLLFGLAFLGAPAHGETGAENLFGPSAGELAVGTRDANGKPGEPVRYNYAYGESDGKTATETKILDGIIESLPEEPAEPHVVDVFTEDTPSGRAKGERVAQRLREIVRKLRAKHGERAGRIEILVVPVPDALGADQARAIEKAAEKTTLAKEFRKALVVPTEFDIRTGAIVGTYRGITSFSTWFATPGINPFVATGLAAFQTTLSTFHAVFARSMANVFRMNIKTPGGPAIGRGNLFVRRQIYGLAIAEIMRLFAGTPPGFDSIDSWAGQGQIISFSLALGALDSIFSGARDRAFLNEPAHFARLYLANFFLLTPWQMLDYAGTYPVLLDLTVYKVRASTIGLLATYFGMYQAVSRSPNKVAFVLDNIFDPLERSLGRIQRMAGKSCRWLLHVADDVGDHFREFIH